MHIEGNLKYQLWYGDVDFPFGICIWRAISITLSSASLDTVTIQPLFWGPGSEFVGRRPIIIVTMTSYTLFHLGQALAQNIETLLVTRFLSGFFAVAPLISTGG